jgi:hypothetical protein
VVNAFRLPHEHDFQLGSLRVVVDEFREFLVNTIMFDWDVDGNSLFEIYDVLLKSSDFNFSILELLKEFQTDFVGLVNLLLHVDNVISGLFQLLL